MAGLRGDVSGGDVTLTLACIDRITNAMHMLITGDAGFTSFAAYV